MPDGVRSMEARLAAFQSRFGALQGRMVAKPAATAAMEGEGE